MGPSKFLLEPYIAQGPFSLTSPLCEQSLPAHKPLPQHLERTGRKRKLLLAAKLLHPEMDGNIVALRTASTSAI